MSKFTLILNLFIALFMSACANTTFIQSSIQTSNEGIFIKSQKQQSFKISFQNPSQLQTTLDKDLALKLKNLGLKEAKENTDYEILINLVDMKKHSYAQKITTSARFFYDFDPLESNGEWMVENYYIMQVNLQINSKNHNSQKTSLIARTTYLGNKKRCQLSLENKIINQIMSFFYF
ncbi:lipoprotein, putative [Campylobacter jejuni subsp. jejuni 414]|nr:lipoprotein, putative [Campylobacter jejuni subsp. jejuni 414]HDZ5026022.1 hypothetical protein [Campylobacter jejuni]HDZ5075935.1 hypothetical protein [Campylobacter jejuni]HEC2791414.1 hypothetical protein [Campylobacter jejuni]